MRIKLIIMFMQNQEEKSEYYIAFTWNTKWQYICIDVFFVI